MTIEELIYDAEGVTFVMMANSDEYKSTKRRESPGHCRCDGFVSRVQDETTYWNAEYALEPRLLKDVFGSTNDMAIAEFMLKNGTLHGEHHKKKAEEPEPRAHDVRMGGRM